MLECGFKSLWLDSSNFLTTINTAPGVVPGLVEGRLEVGHGGQKPWVYDWAEVRGLVDDPGYDVVVCDGGDLAGGEAVLLADDVKDGLL